MARNVFRYGEIPRNEEKIVIQPPFQLKVSQEEILAKKSEDERRRVQHYNGPTVEDIQKEVETFRSGFETEKRQMMQNAKDEADILFESSQKEAELLVEKAQDDANSILLDSEEKAKKIISDARKKAKTDKTEIEKEVNELTSMAKEKGHLEGYNEGFSKGQNEVNRLISKIHLMVGGIVGKRKEILEDSEAQVIELVLQIASRVVKVIQETQKEVVIQNVRSALAKLKSRTDIIIRVNLQDLEIVTDKMKEFQNNVEKVKNITLLEDATVDYGGCIIETDFGHIDARISSQLREIETKIRELAPIVSTGDKT